jgi:hypothetical protein
LDVCGEVLDKPLDTSGTTVKKGDCNKVQQTHMCVLDGAPYSLDDTAML